MKQQTVTINGVVYDTHTGLRLENAARQSHATQQPATATAHRAHHAHQMHSHTQRSRTLNRQAAHKISAKKPTPNQAAAPRPRPQKHPLVQRFATSDIIAPRRAGARPAASRPSARRAAATDIGPVAHPKAVKANAQIAAKKQPAPIKKSAATMPAQEIKQRSLSHALKQAPSHSAGSKQVKSAPRSRWPRAVSIASASLAVLLLAGYFTYLNMPNLSVRVAAAQAGINATYPNYRPDGYSLSGPVAYNSGQVSMKFASNSGPQNFTLIESRSDWDSSAVEQNYANAKWGSDNTATILRQGLTIYASGSEAAWVNGGILYVIKGDAPLSQDQISRIATSM